MIIVDFFIWVKCLEVLRLFVIFFVVEYGEIIFLVINFFGCMKCWFVLYIFIIEEIMVIIVEVYYICCV